MVAAVPGVRVGHWTGDGTGVTVVLLPEGSVGSCEVRAGRRPPGRPRCWTHQAGERSTRWC